MKKKTLGAVGIIIALSVGLAGTYYLTVEPAPAGSAYTIPCEQINDDNPWEVLTTIVEKNNTEHIGVQGNVFVHDDNPERVRMTWESSHLIDVRISWKGGSLIWNHTGTSAQEVVEINYTTDRVLYLRINHVDLGPQGVSYNLTIEIPRLWRTIVSCSATEIHAGAIELENSTFTAEETIRVTIEPVFPDGGSMTVELRRSSDDWMAQKWNVEYWKQQQLTFPAEDIGQTYYLWAYADADVGPLQPRAFSVTIEVPR